MILCSIQYKTSSSPFLSLSDVQNMFLNSGLFSASCSLYKKVLIKTECIRAMWMRNSHENVFLTDNNLEYVKQL